MLAAGCRDGAGSAARAPAAPGLGVAGYYGTAVEYKLEKTHLWRRGLCLSVPWGARGCPTFGGVLPSDRRSRPDLLLGSLLFLCY